jgi:uncharacterized membrane-anchored protein
MRIAVVVALLLIVVLFPWALAVFGVSVLAYGLWVLLSGLGATAFLILMYWYAYKQSERKQRRAEKAKREMR